jgi:hypothetical protein
MFNPPVTGNKDLDAYLYDISLNIGDTAIAAAEEPDIPAGDPGSYPYQYIQVKYATDNVGTNFSNTSTNKTYFGIYNSNSSVESSNPADYTWYLAGVPFGTINFLYYLILGGRKIKFAVNTSPPDYHWKIDDGTAIDLDTIVPSSTISFNELMNAAVTELKIAANAVTATKINVAALDQALGDLKPNTVSAAQIATNAVTELKILNGAITNGKLGTAVITGDKILANTITGSLIAAETIGAGQIAAGAITAVKIEAGAVTADKILAGSVTAGKITVTDLAAINANMGAITAGSLTIGSSPAISGTTMTGSGAKLNTDGTFALGNSSSNINFNGTAININNLANASASNFTSVIDITANTASPYNLLTFTKKNGNTGLISINTSFQLNTTLVGSDSFLLNVYLVLTGNNGWTGTVGFQRIQGVLGPTLYSIKQGGAPMSFTYQFNTNDWGSGAVNATSISAGLAYNASLYDSSGTLLSSSPASWQLFSMSSNNAFYQPLLGS